MAIKTSLTILFVLLVLVIGSAQQLDAPSGRVHGTIFNADGAVVSKVRVIFEGNDWKREVVTNEEGYYEIELPTGVSRITTRSLGFCNSQRAVFRVTQSSQTLMSLTLVVCPMANVLIKNNADNRVTEGDRYIDPFETESFPVKESSDLPLNLLIRYGKRQEDKGVVEYRGAKVINGIPSGVIISYDVLTIVADRVQLNKKLLLIEAEGNVTVENGKQQMKFASVRVDFKARDPLATVRGKE